MKKLFTVFTLLIMLTAFSQSSNHYGFIELQSSSGESNYYTSVYFNVNGSEGLDPGYDSSVFESVPLPFSLYSYLVDDTGYEGLPLGIQTLSETAMLDSTVPLGVNALQGQTVTFTISNGDLDDNIEVYLVDDGNETLLNNSSYNFTADTNIQGGGRFYLRFQEIEQQPLDVEIDIRGFFVKIGGAPEGAEFKVFNEDGIVMYVVLKGKKKEKICLSDLQDGYHVIEVTHDNRVATRTFIHIQNIRR